MKKLTALADKGYWSGEEIKKCEKSNITTIVSSLKEMRIQRYRKSDFKYNEVKDYMFCPI